MSSFVFQEPSMAIYLPLILLFFVMHIYREKNRQRDLNEFTSVHKSLSAVRISRLILLTLSVVMMVFALMRPAWSKIPKVLKKEGRDLVFILDVSNSMLAEDVVPNRLSRAKLAISEAVDSLEDHRVGLVVFAGSATIKCPLTLDYEFFTSMLSQVGPESAAQGGTRIEDALLKTCDKLFSDSRKGYKDIILISDGGDQGKNIDRAVKVVNEQNIKLIAIGIGDEQDGARIPTESGFMQVKGKEVWTKLESKTMQNFVRQCNKGAYLPAGTAQFDLGRIYEQLTRNDAVVEMGEQSVMVYEEKYHFFLMAALFLLALSILPHFTRTTKQAAVVLLLAGFTPDLKATEPVLKQAPKVSAEKLKILSGRLQALLNQEESIVSLFEMADIQFELGLYEEAVTTYESLLRLELSAPLRIKVMYNLANSQVKQGAQSEELALGLYAVNSSLINYRRVILQSPSFRDAAINFEMAKKIRREIQDKIDEERRQQEEMQAALEALRQFLMALVEQQKDNLQNSIEEKETRALIEQMESTILEKTKQLQVDINQFEKKYFPELDREHSPFTAPLKSLAEAENSEVQAIEILKKLVKDSIPSQKAALQSLEKALEQFPQDPSQQQNQGESDEDSDSEEGEEDYDEESEEEGDGEYGEPSDTEKVDLENQDIPPPTDTPEDILKREQKIQDIRQKNKSGKKRPAVEKDY